MNADVSEGPSTDVTDREDINTGETVADELYSLLDEVDSGSGAEEFGIGTHSKTHDFDNQLKIGIFEGVLPSDSLAEPDEKTATHDQLPYMTGSTVLSSQLMQQISHSPDQSLLPVHSTNRWLSTNFSQPTVDSSSISTRA